MRDFRPKETPKPPYRIPLMSEIARVPKNGLKVVSTFSGCGGSCLGFKMAGYEILVASEFVEAAQEVYMLNNPGVPMILGDVRDLDPTILLEYLGLEVGELDVFEGSPPCASFSTAGKRDAGWGDVRKYSDTEQRTDDLFFEYARLVDGLKPKVFVAENVTGLVKGVAKGYFKEIHETLVKLGYRVTANVLDAQWLGVPQARQRVVFIGVREDLGIAPPVVPALPYRYTVRDAIPLAVRVGTAPPHKDWTRNKRSVASTMVSADTQPSATIVAAGENKGAGWVEVFVPERVIHDTSGEWSKGDVTDEPCPTITVGVDGLNSQHYQVEGEVVRVIHGYPQSGMAQQGDVTDKPCPTIMADAKAPEWFTVETVAAPFVGDDAETHERQRDEADITRFVTGPEWDKLGPGGQSKKFFNLVKADPDEPSPTVTSATAFAIGAASVTHPIERRKFTIPELKRICGFPDDFVLTGTYRQQWERLGRAVPPPMMYAVAKAIAEQVFSATTATGSTDEGGTI